MSLHVSCEEKNLHCLVRALGAFIQNILEFLLSMTVFEMSCKAFSVRSFVGTPGVEDEVCLV